MSKTKEQTFYFDTNTVGVLNSPTIRQLKLKNYKVRAVPQIRHQ
jgi:hypothetical protein